MDRKATRFVSHKTKAGPSSTSKKKDLKKPPKEPVVPVQDLETQSSEKAVLPTVGTYATSSKLKRKSVSDSSPLSKRLCTSSAKPRKSNFLCNVCLSRFKEEVELSLHMKSVHSPKPKRQRKVKTFVNFYENKTKPSLVSKKVLKTENNMYEKYDKFSDWKIVKKQKIVPQVDDSEDGFEILPDQLLVQLTEPSNNIELISSNEIEDTSSKKSKGKKASNFNTQTSLKNIPVKKHSKKTKKSKKIKSRSKSKISSTQKKSSNSNQLLKNKMTKHIAEPSIKIEPLSDDSQDLASFNDPELNLQHAVNTGIKIKTEPDFDLSDYNILIPKIELSVCDEEIDCNSASHSVLGSDKEEYDSDDTEEVMCYRCPYCMLIHDRRDFFKRHISVSKNCNVEIYKVSPSELQNLQPSSCTVCNTTFSNFEIFTHHMNTHKFHVCTVCNHSFVYLCELSRHQVLKNHDVDVFKCYVCDDKFGTEIRLKEHFTCTHPKLEVSFSCQVCKSLFLTSKELFEHCSSVLKTELSNVENDYYKTKVAYFRQLQYNDGPCHEMVLKNDASLIQIAIKDLKTNAYSCYVCKNNYSNINYLDQHFASKHLTQYLNEESNVTQQVTEAYSKETEGKNSDNSKENCELDPFESFVLDEKQIKVEPETETEEISPDKVNEPNPMLNIIHIKTEKNKLPNIKKNPIKIKSIQLKIDNPASEKCSINLPSTSEATKISNDQSLGFFFESDSIKNQSSFTEKFKNSIFTVSYKPKSEDETFEIKSEIVIDEEDILSKVDNSPPEDTVINELDGSYWCEICESKVYPEHRNVQHAPVQKLFEPFPCPDCNSVFNTFIELKKHSINFHPTSKKIFPYRKTGVKVDKRRRSTEVPSDTPELSEGSQSLDEIASTSTNQSLQNKSKINKSRLKSTPCRSRTGANYFISTLGEKYFQTIEICEENTSGEISLYAKDTEYFLEYCYFKCHLCDKNYVDSESYSKHFALNHNGKAQFKCFVCDEVFYSQTFRTMHFKQHSEVVLNCANCNKDIQHNEFFKRHHKTCEGGKCSFCVKTVVHVFDMRTHAKKHVTSSNNAYGCKLCHNYFFTKYNLENHFKTIHAINLTEQ